MSHFEAGLWVWSMLLVTQLWSSILRHPRNVAKWALVKPLTSFDDDLCSVDSAMISIADTGPKTKTACCEVLDRNFIALCVGQNMIWVFVWGRFSRLCAEAASHFLFVCPWASHGWNFFPRTFPHLFQESWVNSWYTRLPIGRPAPSLSITGHLSRTYAPGENAARRVEEFMPFWNQASIHSHFERRHFLNFVC